MCVEVRKEEGGGGRREEAGFGRRLGAEKTFRHKVGK